MKKGYLILLLMVSCSFFCKNKNMPPISIDTFAEFHAKCLMINNAYPNSIKEKNLLLAKAMHDFSVDSTKLESFFSYYKKNPQQWPEVEEAILKKLEKLSKRS